MTQSSVLGRRVGFGRIAVVLLSIVALILGLNPTVARAQGEKRADVQFSNIKLTTEDGSDDVSRWEFLEFSFDWALPDAAPYKAGDYFTIDVPQQLGLSRTETFYLKTDDGANGASCVLPVEATNGVREMKCTFLPEASLEDKDHISGTAHLRLQAREVYEESSLPFDMNGVPAIVELPGGNGIVGTNVGADLNKHGWYREDGKIRWNAVIPGPSIADREFANVTIRDVLRGGGTTTSPHKHIGECSLDTFVIGQPTTAVVNVPGQIPGFQCAIDPADNTKMTVTLTPPVNGWSAEHVYYLGFTTEPIDPSTTVVGAETGNDMTVTQEGYNIGEDDGVVYRESYGGGTITGVDRGSFQIVKELAADSAEVDPAKQYVFKASYTLNGKQVSEEVKVTANGQAHAGSKPLPLGTEVTLREVTPTADGVTFEDPVFTVTSGDDVEIGTDDQGPYVKFKTKSASNVAFKVTNKAVTTDEEGGLHITKKVDGISGFIFERNREFEFTATIVEPTETRTETFTLKNGETKSYTDLPVGTKVTIKETLPGDSLISNWKTPTFTSDSDNVVDNGDGSVTITVTDDDDTSVTKVDVNNSANPPIWWVLLLLLPLIPLIPQIQLPQIPGPAPAPAPAPAPSEPAAPTKGVTKGVPASNKTQNTQRTVPQGMGGATTQTTQAASAKTLANTGASVWAIGIIALLLMLAGAVAIIRNKRA